MWLLHTKTLELRHFTKPEDSNTPYAILSHVWEDADHAQSFQDIRAIHARCVRSGEDPRTLVTEKVRRFCILAEEAGYEWVWLDTACIDKTSSAELSEAINSMWAWYRDAEVCYAYLCDVGDDDDPRAPNSEFRRCKWFTRGWTLQELIAPLHVVFLSQGWNVIGTRISLLAIVAEVTGIDVGVLAQKRVSQLWGVSVAKRMSWASRRQTSRIEDRAYSLLGVFGVSMPIIYGEGLYSFTRLQIEILRHTQDHSIFAWGALHPDFDVACAGIERTDEFSRTQYFQRQAQVVPKVPSHPSTPWNALLASSPDDFKLSGNIIRVSECDYTVDFRCRPAWNHTFTSNGILTTLPLSTECATMEGSTGRLYAAALCCSTAVLGAGTRKTSRYYIVLFLISMASEVTAALGCQYVGTVSAQNGEATFYRGAVLEVPQSKILPRNFVMRELSIGAGMAHPFWRWSTIPTATSYRFLVPHWVIRRLQFRYGFHIQWSGPISHDGYHITEVPGSLLPLDSSLPRSSSIPVFDLRFFNYHLEETLIIEFGVGCDCPQARVMRYLLPQHWWLNVRVASGCFGPVSRPSLDDSRQSVQFVQPGPNEVPIVLPAGQVMFLDTGCPKKHLIIDPMLPHTRRHIAFTHLHRTVHVQSVPSASNMIHDYSRLITPSPIIIMLDLEGFDVDLVHSPTRTDRSPLPALPQVPGHTGVAEPPSIGTASDASSSEDSSPTPTTSWATLITVSQSTLRKCWRSMMDWIQAEVDCTYGSLV